MPLEEARCERILTMMKSMDIEERLKAINEAKEHQREAFAGEMSDKDYAYSAYFLETCYNLLREELRVKQIRVKQDSGKGDSIPVNSTPKGVKAVSKVRREKPKPIDMAAMMAQFAAFAAQKKE